MEIRSLKLYHDSGTRSSRVLWLLFEIEADLRFQVERVSLQNREHYSATFSQISPTHVVPVLEITWADAEKLHMIESAAIITFLADAFPHSALAPTPSSTCRRAEYLQMVHFGSTTMDMMLWQLRLHERLLPVGDRDSRGVARNRAMFRDKVEPRLEARLNQDLYVCGPDFSAADCVIGHNVLWARRHGLCKATAFSRYLNTLAARPACAKAFDDNPNLLSELLSASRGDA